MISEEILRKVRRLEIISRKSAQDLFAGQYHTAFKGRGVEFSEVREYQPGDDPRFIDGNVSSRLGRLYVKQFHEERELTIILALDLSASLHFFSGGRSKRDVAAEVTALIAFTALLNNDKVGLLLFSDGVERFVPPKKGRLHMLRLIREAVEAAPRNRGTDIGAALTYLNRVLKKRAIVFIVSDFLAGDFATPLKIAGRKHDVVAVDVADRRESEPPEGGKFLLRDLESGEEFLADFDRPEVRDAFRRHGESQRRQRGELFVRHGVDAVQVRCEDGYEKALFDFFLRRRRRLAR